MNPFLDVGFPPDEAAALQVRAELALALEQHILRKRWTQAQAARELRIPQPTVSKIMNGNIERLSIDFLVKLMARARLPFSIETPRRRMRRGAQRAASVMAEAAR